MNYLKPLLRQLSRNLSFTVTAILTLAVCIGANIVIFTVVDGILFRPLPFPEPDRLVSIYHHYPKSDLGRSASSTPDLYMRRDKIDAFASIGAYKASAVIVGESGAGRREEILRVSSDFFETLGVQPNIGRAFTEDEMTFQTHHVAILSDGYWRRHFSADPDVLGSNVRVNGFDKTIIGVLPPGFRFLSTNPEILLPLSSAAANREIAALHSNSDWEMIARLKPGVSLVEAQASLNAVDAGIQSQFRWAKDVAEAGYQAVIAPLHADHVAGIRPTLLLLQIGGLLLLLIGAVNLLNLLLVHASARVKELAVRQSLGASRLQVLLQTLSETLSLTLMGGIAGIGLGAAAVRLLYVFGVDRLPMGLHVVLDGRVLVMALCGTVLLGIALGLPLAWFHLRGQIVAVLQSETRGGTTSRGVQRLRHSFVVAQIALAFVLLTGAGLLSVSLKRALETSPGFHPEHLLSGYISLIHKNYLDQQVRLQYADQVIERVRQLPSIQYTGIVSSAPVAGHSGENDIRIMTVPDSLVQSGPPIAPYIYGVAGDYFRAMGIPLYAGRLFDGGELSRDERVCLVDKTFAERHWTNTTAIGKRIYDGPEIGPDEAAFTVIGVVGSVKQTELTEQLDQGAVYFSLGDLVTGFSGVHLVTRTLQQPQAMIPLLTKTLRDIEPELPLSNVKMMEDRIADTLIAQRSAALLAKVFAISALLLAAIGTYGVLSYSVSQRRREIGVRMALGALPKQVSRQFLSVGLRLLGIRTFLGLGGAWFAGQSMQGLLFNVPPLHLFTLLGTTLLLGIVALIASWLPANRAAKVNPMEVLRSD